MSVLGSRGGGGAKRKELIIKNANLTALFLYSEISVVLSFALLTRANILFSTSGASLFLIVSTHSEPDTKTLSLVVSSVVSKFSSTIIKT